MFEMFRHLAPSCGRGNLALNQGNLGGRRLDTGDWDHNGQIRPQNWSLRDEGAPRDSENMSGPKPVLDIDRLEQDIDRLHAEYQAASPYPHIVLDDFLEPEAAKAAMAEFPPSTRSGGTTTSTSTSASSATPTRARGGLLCSKSSRSSIRRALCASSASFSAWMT
jgi:hypothetical protein